MKSPFLTLLAGVCSVHALPPAPYDTLYGTVRDDVGQIVEVQGAQIIPLKGGLGNLPCGAASPAHFILSRPLAPPEPPHSPTPVRVLTVSGAAGATANSLQ